ncbi:hypothetical protein T440DRAFT_473021 [Plenodomus tracheiphilus IPT5]|uniref:EthD domain-containing protein n=1 Tax=Plenodomus tracheiphilus IPT5 TaxID=1408161 RepID=A0A6A7ANR6_9PLEO|nr:hypothetical protein T440DRAFT_473021 [Plenodomus tracheiphilus IPT5]
MNAPPKYKLLLFFKRNSSISPSEFKAYYEANHAPLIMEIAKTYKGLLRYTRRYLDHEASDPASKNPFTTFGTPAPTIEFDMVNEVTFSSRAAAREFEQALYGIQENATKAAKDEITLFDQNLMRGMIVEEIVSIE